MPAVGGLGAVMQKDIATIYRKIRELEDQVDDYLEELREQFSYTLQNGKVRFDAAVKSAHLEAKIGRAHV